MADLTEADVLLEFQRVGAYVRVAAIDPVTNTEVFVQGPADYAEEMLRRTAIAKLNYVMRKKAAATLGDGKLKPGGGGLIV